MGQVPYELIGTGSWNQSWNQSEFQIHQFLAELFLQLCFLNGGEILGEIS